MLRLYKKYREIIDYIIAGLMTTVVAFVAYKATTVALIGFDPMHNADGSASDLLIIIAQIVQWVLSVAFAFVVNKLFVFRNKENERGSVIRQLGTFAGSRVLTWFLETGIVLGGNKLFGLLGLFQPKEEYADGIIGMIEKIFTADFIAKCVAAVFVIVCNYFISKFIVFKKKKTQDDCDVKDQG